MQYDEMVRMREKLQKELQTLDEALSLHESEQTDTRDLSTVPKESTIGPSPSVDSLLLTEPPRPSLSRSDAATSQPSLPSLPLQFAAKDRRGRPASAPPARIDADRLRAVIRPASAGTQRERPASAARSRSSTGGARERPAREVPLISDFQAFVDRVDVASRDVWMPHGVRAAARLDRGVLVFSFAGPRAQAERDRINAWLRSKAPSWKPLGLEPFPPVWNLLARGGILLFALRPNWLPASLPAPPSLRKVLGEKKELEPRIKGARLYRVHTAASASKMQVYALDGNPDAQAHLPPPAQTKPGYRSASIW